MHCSILILLALGEGKSYHLLRDILNAELGERSPARDSNDFAYEIDQLQQAGAITMSDYQIVITDVGKDLLQNNKALQFIAKRLA